MRPEADEMTHAQALRLSFFLTAITCSLVAALGYAMYGTAVRDIVTFNLPRVSRHLECQLPMHYLS